MAEHAHIMPGLQVKRSDASLLLAALVTTLGLWLAAIVISLLEGSTISATPIICWWICWSFAAVATLNLSDRRAGGRA